VSSIAEAGESSSGDENGPASPSVPVRFCLASEEILRLTDPHLEKNAGITEARPKVKPPHGGAVSKSTESKK